MERSGASPRTVSDAVRHARERLAPSGSARTDADELVSRALGIERGALRLGNARPVALEVWERIDRWLDRRIAGEPVQYVTGRAAFRDLDLEVGPGVLVPRPETEQLVAAVLD